MPRTGRMLGRVTIYVGAMVRGGDSFSSQALV